MKHTPGNISLQPWSGWEKDQLHKNHFIGQIVSDNGQTIYGGPSSFQALRGATPTEAVANAELIVEVFNVTHTTGKTPQQLSDRVQELEKEKGDLVEVLKMIYEDDIKNAILLPSIRSKMKGLLNKNS